MAKLEADYFGMEPEDFPALDLNRYSNEALRELAYFIWTAYPDDAALMLWRKEKLLPLLAIDDFVYLNDADEEEED